MLLSPCFITPITADEAKDIDYLFRRTKNKIKAANSPASVGGRNGQINTYFFSFLPKSFLSWILALIFLIYSDYYHFINRAWRKKPSRIWVVRLEQEGSSYNFGDYKNKGVYPSPLVSFHFRRSGTNTSPNSFESRPAFSPLTNYVTTTEQTCLTNIVYAPLM